MQKSMWRVQSRIEVIRLDGGRNEENARKRISKQRGKSKQTREEKR